MPAIYQGDKKIVDRYVGEKLIVRAYQGDKLIFDAYSELSGTLPLTVRSRASQILKNYRIYGTTSGAGVETENLLNIDRQRSDVFTLDPKYYIYGGRADNKSTTTDGVDIVVADKLRVWTRTGAPGAGFIIPVLPNTTYTLSYDIDVSVADEKSSAALNLINDNEELGRYWAIYGSTTTNTFTTRDKTKYVYIVFRVGGVTATYSNITLTEGSTAPSSYIPYGYKLPLTVRTENLFDKDSTPYSVSHYISSENVLTSNGGFNVTDFIEVNSNTNYYLSKVNGTSTYPAICFYDTNKEFISGEGYRTRSSMRITTPENCKYVRLSVNKGYYDLAMLTEGIAAPSSYIPYYNTETPIYIGDSQLMEGEYVDYEEQKVYKRTENVVPPSDKQTIEINGMKMSTDGDGIYRFDGTTTEATSFSINLKSAFIIPSRAENGICCFFNSFTGVTVSFYDDTSRRDVWSMTSVNKMADQYTTMAGKRCNRIVVSIPANVTINGTIAPVLTKGAQTSKFIPYIQSTDPPVPLPDIALPQAEVTIDIDEDIKPQATVKGRINPVT